MLSKLSCDHRRQRTRKTLRSGVFYRCVYLYLLDYILDLRIWITCVRQERKLTPHTFIQATGFSQKYFSNPPDMNQHSELSHV